jgi:hypothetical protein
VLIEGKRKVLWGIAQLVTTTKGEVEVANHTKWGPNVGGTLWRLHYTT